MLALFEHPCFLGLSPFLYSSLSFGIRSVVIPFNTYFPLALL